MVPVTWWPRVFLPSLTRQEPFPTSRLLIQLFDFLERETDEKTVKVKALMMRVRLCRFSLIMTSTLCPLMSLPGLIFQWVELFSCLSSVFLCCGLPHILLIILCQVFIKPRRSLYCPDATNQMGRTAGEEIWGNECSYWTWRLPLCPEME